MQRRERGQGQHCETAGRICDDPLPGLGRAWQAWSSSGPSGGVPQSECLGSPWRLRGGCAAALPPRGSRLPWQQQGFPGLRASILANMCRRKVRPEEEGSQTELLQTAGEIIPLLSPGSGPTGIPAGRVGGAGPLPGRAGKIQGSLPTTGFPSEPPVTWSLIWGFHVPPTPGGTPPSRLYASTWEWRKARVREENLLQIATRTN